MEMILLGLLLCTLLFGTDTAPIAKNNTIITSEYYAKLIAGANPNLAKLNLFVTALPKGGDLHNHYSGAIYAETYLDWVTEFNYCIYTENNANLNAQIYMIETNVSRLTTAADKAICISADAVRQNDELYRGVLSHWSDRDYSNHNHDQLAPDDQFFTTFTYFGTIAKLNYFKGLTLLKNMAKSENVQYLEIMLTGGPVVSIASLAASVNALNSSLSDVVIHQTLAAYYHALRKDDTVRKTISSYIELVENAWAGIEDASFTLRFHAYVTRSRTPAEIFGSLYSSFTALNSTKVIVGVNIVGPENGIVALQDYTLHMKMIRFLKTYYIPNVKLALHAGELAVGMVLPNLLQFHISQAVQIAGADRIGHGVDISYENGAYTLLEKMKQRKVAVEICLTSNAFILGVENEAHPIQIYRAQGVPIVIAADDPGVSRSSLSNEYLLFTSRYTPTYAQLKATVYNSINYSFMTVSDKAKQINLLARRFVDFEAKIAKMLKQKAS